MSVNWHSTLGSATCDQSNGHGIKPSRWACVDHEWETSLKWAYVLRLVIWETSGLGPLVTLSYHVHHLQSRKIRFPSRNTKQKPKKQILSPLLLGQREFYWFFLYKIRQLYEIRELYEVVKSFFQLFFQLFLKTEFSRW
jgi:hypothetical protein